MPHKTPEQFEKETLSNAIKLFDYEYVVKNKRVGRIILVVGIAASILAYYLFKRGFLNDSWWGSLNFLAGILFGSGCIYVRSSSISELLRPYIDIDSVKSRIEELDKVDR